MHSNMNYHKLLLLNKDLLRKNIVALPSFKSGYIDHCIVKNQTHLNMTYQAKFDTSYQLPTIIGIQLYYPEP